MAYEKYTWVDGELITAEKLNHMEDGIAEGGDCGYECTETTEQLFSETVTTVDDGGFNIARLAYQSELITADELIVIFNGTEYVCPKIVTDGIEGVYYGGVNSTTGFDFSNYPFAIGSDFTGNTVITESPMTVTVSASATSLTVETTECFEKAVSKIVSPMLFECERSVATSYTNDSLTTVKEGDDLPSAVLSESIAAYGIKVVLDGVEYFCSSMLIDGLFYYGSVDFSMTDFPFVIECDPESPEGCTLYTKTAGVHSIYIEQYRYTPTSVSPCLASVIEQIVTILQSRK